jgi:hypothetical protein
MIADASAWLPVKAVPLCESSPLHESIEPVAFTSSMSPALIARRSPTPTTSWRTCSRVLLAAGFLFATLHASKTVYAQPPRRGAPQGALPVQSASPREAPSSSDARDDGRASGETSSSRSMPEAPSAKRSGATTTTPATATTTTTTSAVKLARRDGHAGVGSFDAAPAPADAPKTAAPKTAAPKTDAPKTDAPKTAAPKAAAPKTGEPTGAAPGARPGSKQVFSLDEFLVEGKLEKPSAYYILRRSSADHDWARLDARFLPLVLESVQDPLF